MATNGFDDDQTRSFTNLDAGTKVSHYTIISKIGAGGMGEVYLAEDSQLDRKVALKFLPSHLCQDRDCRARFTREAKAAAKLDHPNIVPVYEVSECQGRPFFAMAHIEGHSLREVIKQSKLSVSEAIDHTMQICEGLHKAHESGVVHRDIKPANVIVDGENRARILDFGLATVSGEEKLTKTGSTLGTVGYMAPEQIEGRQIDHRSDLFSVGVILYEMLAGRRPFEGDNDAAVVRSIADATPEPVSRFRVGVSDNLQRIISKTLDKSADMRYQSASEIMTDLKRELRDQSDPSRSSEVLRTTSLKRNHNLFLIAALIAVAVIVAGIIYFSGQLQPSEPLQQRQLTFYGDIIGSDISPGGEFFIFVREYDKYCELLLQEVTGEHPVVLLTWYHITDAKFSSDGAQIAVAGIVDSTLREYGTFLISRLGGSPRLLRRGLCSDLSSSWSPNSEEIAIQESCSHDRDSILVISPASNDKRYIPIGLDFDWLNYLDWSPDGDKLLLTTQTEDSDGTWIINTNGTLVSKLVDRELNNIQWASNPNCLYYLDNHLGYNALMKQKIDTRSFEKEGPPSLLVSGLKALEFSITSDSRRLLYLKQNLWSNLWQFTVGDRDNEPNTSRKQLTTGTHSIDDPVFSPDGSRIAFSMRSHGEYDIWTISSDGGDAKQISFTGKTNRFPAWSQNGKQIAFMNLNEKPSIKIKDLDGNTIRTIENPGIGGQDIIWPRDTIMVYVTPGLQNLQIYNPETEESRLLLALESEAWFGEYKLSPSGKWIASRWNNPFQGRGLWIFSIIDTTRTFLLEGFPQPLGWSEGEDSIYYAQQLTTRSGDFKYICRINIHDKSVDTLCTLPFDHVSQVSMSPDRRRFVVNVYTNQRDLWLVENFDPDVK